MLPGSIRLSINLGNRGMAMKKLLAVALMAMGLMATGAKADPIGPDCSAEQFVLRRHLHSGVCDGDADRVADPSAHRLHAATTVVRRRTISSRSRSSRHPRYLLRRRWSAPLPPAHGRYHAGGLSNGVAMGLAAVLRAHRAETIWPWSARPTSGSSTSRSPTRAIGFIGPGLASIKVNYDPAIRDHRFRTHHAAAQSRLLHP